MTTKDKKERSTFVPANDEQSKSIEQGQHFIDKGNPAEWFCLSGKAGVGKTHITVEIIAPYIKKKTVIIAALSHKAKLVLANKLMARFGTTSVGAETIASLLGMKYDNETGKFTLDPNSKYKGCPIEYADIVICDECSMINEAGLFNIMAKKPKKCKVIFVGDIGQLPPIREQEDEENRDKPSPTFDTPNKAVLHERVRQGEESPILPYADLFWNNSQSAEPVLSPASTEQRISTVTGKGSLVFSKGAGAIDSVLDLYREAVESGNQDIVRCVVYRNKMRHILNNRIRKMLFGDDSEKQYLEGELIIFSDSFGTDDNDKISNSTELQIKKIQETSTDDGYDIFELGISYEGKPMDIPVLQDYEVKRFKGHLNALANEAKSMPFGFARTKAWEDFRAEEARFAEIEYGYVVSSHKAQGSTYDVALIAEQDIMSVTLTSNKTKSQSIYTGITRAKYLAIIMDSYTDHPDALSKAIEQLKLQR